MIDTVEYFIGDELEPLQLWWEANGSLVDFSITHTYSLVVAKISSPSTAAFTKTTGFTGAAGSGTKNNGVPNLTASWTASGELNSLTASGAYLCDIVATRNSDGLQRTGRVHLTMKKRAGT